MAGTASDGPASGCPAETEVDAAAADEASSGEASGREASGLDPVAIGALGSARLEGEGSGDDMEGVGRGQWGENFKEY